MTERVLHIVSFDVPYPPDYGGAVDVYYKLKHLHEAGVRIILHSHLYGREKSKILNEFCEKVYFYPRKKHIGHLATTRPFIVESRISRQLVKRLKQDTYPVLVEGIHNAWLLEDRELRERISVRTHNVEHTYYEHLAARASGLRKIYFRSEARKLKRYETILREAAHLFPLSEADCEHFRRINPSTQLLPAFFGDRPATFSTSDEKYILYHGNLGVTENSEAVSWLSRQVFSRLERTCIIVAGKSPGEKLRAGLEACGVKLVADPDEKRMRELISGAAAHVLYSNQDTGIKLKLLHALQTNAPVIVNEVLVHGNDLAKLCRVANTADEFVHFIETLQPLTASELDFRKKFLETHYNRTDLLVRALFS